MMEDALEKLMVVGVEEIEGKIYLISVMDD
jgi:hypothetical protein